MIEKSSNYMYYMLQNVIHLALYPISFFSFIIYTTAA